MVFYIYLTLLSDSLTSIVLDTDEMNNFWSNESIPESDSTPHINIGPHFQCRIPSRSYNSSNKMNPDSCYEDLLWDPGITKCSDTEGKYPCTHLSKY